MIQVVGKCFAYLTVQKILPIDNFTNLVVKNLPK